VLNLEIGSDGNGKIKENMIQNVNQKTQSNPRSSGIAALFSKNPRRAKLIEILQSKRRVGRFVIVEAETHNEGGKNKPGIGGKEYGNGQTQA